MNNWQRFTAGWGMTTRRGSCSLLSSASVDPPKIMRVRHGRIFGLVSWLCYRLSLAALICGRPSHLIPEGHRNLVLWHTP
jgi:hypothetical protein